jgi:hypothetical protein
MSEICGVCGRPDAFYEAYGDTCRTSIEGYTAEEEATCYRLGYQRTLARADRYEAEFSACKALLIAEQKRAERAEAERAEAEEHENSWAINATDFAAIQNGRVAAAEQKASEARALALEEAAEKALSFCPVNTTNHRCYPVEIAEAIRALAALPVEPARRPGQKEIQRAGAVAPTPPDRCEKCNAALVASNMCVECGHVHGVPEVPEIDRPRCKATTRRGWPCPAFVSNGLDYCYGHSAQRIRALEAELARSTSEPAPQSELNPPPSPTGDAE